MNTTKLVLGISISLGVCATLFLSACGGNPTTVNPLSVDAGDAAADAPHDAAADAPAKIEDASAD